MTPPLAAPVARHPPDRLARAQHRTQDVDLDEPADFRRRHVGQVRRAAVQAGIVDQTGQWPERLLGAFEDARNVGLESSIGLHGGGGAAGPRNVGDDRLGRLAALDIGREHRPATLGRQFGRRRTDAAAAAGDDENAAHATRRNFGSVMSAVTGWNKTSTAPPISGVSSTRLLASSGPSSSRTTQTR